MTMTEIRKAVAEQNRYCKVTGLDELVEYNNGLLETLEELWKYGYTRNFSNDFLAYANGLQINTGNYKTLHISQDHNLRSIEATKAVVKELGTIIFG